jgi:hypothetical protein
MVAAAAAAAAVVVVAVVDSSYALWLRHWDGSGPRQGEHPPLKAVTITMVKTQQTEHT